jgi:thiamine-monophosphate kinase
MARAARELKLVLAGGDTAQFSRVAISILVAGRAAPRRAVRRDTARPGDCLFVTGGLGYAQLGLEVLKRKIPAGQAAGFLEKHLYPRARVEFGAWLSRRGYASAMIDVSDGFSTDLIRLCKASGVGARILEFTLPAPVITPFLKSHRLHPLRAALHGGDDYELLFTVPAKAARRIPGAYRGVRIVFLGRITRAREGIRVVRSDGSSYALHPLGWEHFRKP